nr:AMP-binding protein [Deinococcus budaensis]
MPSPQTGRTVKTPLTPLDAVLRALALRPERPLLEEGGQTVSTAQFAGRTARLVTLLREQGLTSGGHVLLISPNSGDALLAFHAVPLAGGVIVPLNPAFGDEALRFLSGHADPVLALVDAAHLPRVAEALHKSGVPTLPIGAGSTLAGRLAGVAPAPLALPDRLDEDQPISINYTSGTTSDPKGVMLTHRGAFVNLANMLYHLDLRPGSVFLHALPLAHGNGWGCAWAVTAAGGTHVTLPELTPERLRAALLTGRVTHLCASPALLAPLADAAAPLSLPRPVRLAVAGTSPHPRLLGTLQAQGFEVLHSYGLTETSALLTLTDSADLAGLPDAPAVLARQGHPMIFGGQVRVVTPGGAPVPPDGATPGEVVIRSNQTMKGYYKNRAATRRALQNGWLHTGDVACVHPDGRLEILDRAGDLLSVAGQTVSSVEIEAVLYRHPSVREAVVVAAPGEGGGGDDLPVAFVTLHPGAGVQPRELLDFARPHLPPHALPTRIVFAPELPKTASGKVLKHALRAQARARAGGAVGD